MPSNFKDKVFPFLAGFLIGVLAVSAGGVVLYKAYRVIRQHDLSRHFTWIKNISLPDFSPKNKSVTENFSESLTAVSGKSFGKYGQLTFETYRDGQFIINGREDYAWQKSDSYRDSAFIRSTNPLPKTYKVSVVAGEIDYGLGKIEGLKPDPEYPEGPQNENGCYLLAITDEAPTGHHTNIWWHQHRKLVIDVDNNVWGHGMPNPIFMVYFNKDNKLVSFDGSRDEWQREWQKAVTYDANSFYKVQVEKTKDKYILSVYTGKGSLLKRAAVDRKDVWHSGDEYPEYIVVGDPHENYYQGSMKIKSVSIPVTKK